MNARSHSFFKDNSHIAKKTGELKAKYGGISIVDCAIVATAVHAKADHVIVSEKEIKHFKEKWINREGQEVETPKAKIVKFETEIPF